MSYQKTRLGRVVRRNPARAAQMMVEAFAQASGNRRRAAKLLDCSYTTFGNWRRRLEAEGFLPKGSLSRMKQRANDELLAQGRITV